MRLEEIEQVTAEEQRVRRLKDAAQAAKDNAKEMTSRAKLSADQLKMQKSREQLTKAQTPSAMAKIKPHA